MLSGGSAPFRGDSSNSLGSTARERIAWEHINMPLPPIRALNKSLPESIENVISTALNKNPSMRYNTTMDMREAFEYARMQSGQKRNPISTIIDHPVDLTQIRKLTKLPQKKTDHKPRRIRGRADIPQLLGVDGEKAGQIIEIGNQGLKIGRTKKNTLQLHEKSVSRFHSLVWITTDGTYIRDENSSLGTYVNGKKIVEPNRLFRGDKIQIGRGQVFEYWEP